jgi:hypothetical protein
MSALSPTFSEGTPVVSLLAAAAKPFESIRRLDVTALTGVIAELTLQPDRTPTPRAVELATAWLNEVFDTATNLGGWSRPHLSSTAAGEIVFEWWKDTRKLTLYFGDGGAEFIRVWGSDIENEMNSGDLTHW